MQHAGHGRGSGAFDGSRFRPSAGAPVGDISAQAAALLRATRRGSAESRVIGQNLQSHSPGAAQVDKNAVHIGAVAFIHHFGASLNEQVHFHVCVVDRVFEVVVEQKSKRAIANGLPGTCRSWRSTYTASQSFEAQKMDAHGAHYRDMRPVDRKMPCHRPHSAPRPAWRVPATE